MEALLFINPSAWWIVVSELHEWRNLFITHNSDWTGVVLISCSTSTTSKLLLSLCIQGAFVTRWLGDLCPGLRSSVGWWMWVRVEGDRAWRGRAASHAGHTDGGGGGRVCPAGSSTVTLPDRFMLMRLLAWATTTGRRLRHHRYWLTGESWEGQIKCGWKNWDVLQTLMNVIRFRSTESLHSIWQDET